MSIRNKFYEQRKEFATVQEFFQYVFGEFGSRDLFRYDLNGTIVNQTYEKTEQDMNTISAVLEKHNFKQKNIVLLGKTSYEWITAYYGILNSANVAVPLDRLLNDKEIEKLIIHTDAVGIFYDAEYKGIVENLKKEGYLFEFLYCLNSENGENIQRILNKPESLQPVKVKATDVAQIVFTSGTFGVNKGVVLTHKNLASNIHFAVSILNLEESYRMLSILPNNHTYELTDDILAPLYLGATMCINQELKTIKKNLVKYSPNLMIVVPSILEMMQKEIVRQLKKQKLEDKFNRALKLSKFFLKFGIDLRRKLFADVHKVFGGDLKKVICGSAFLPDEVYDFFVDIGVIVIQGYGITECSPLVAVNSDKCCKKGTVGLIPEQSGCRVQIVEGEIWVKGDNVMKEYYKLPEETKKSFEGGWFKTGDLGYMDQDGYLYITGRKKNMILLKNGQNVIPEELENRVMELETVNEVCVYAKNDCIQAEIFPVFDTFEQLSISDVEKQLMSQIKQLNKQLPFYKHIQKVVVREKPFEKTTTNKIKRNLIQKNG